MSDNDAFEDFDVLDERMDRPKSGKLPSTLLALCILTFVGSAFVLLKDLISFQFFEGDADLPMVYLIEVLSCFGCIAGAIVMMQMKIAGYYIYLVSNIAYILAVIWYWFGIMDIPLNEWLIIILIVYIAAPIGFIILYSSQKKFLY